MSTMYRAEVPLYGTLIDVVRQTNDVILRADPELRHTFAQSNELTRIGDERHGAIRVGTAAELSLLGRIFAIMGMRAVGYYDLSVAGVPVHSTAFRPVDPHALSQCPFRIFTSLLRLDLIEDNDLRAQAAALLASREIVTAQGLALIRSAERAGGLARDDVSAFIAEILETFRWHGDAIAPFGIYRDLIAEHRLVADIVCFKGPHINHLTPRSLDIDAAHDAMIQCGIDMKAVIEGPPARAVPILIRQTSFKAIVEHIRFDDDGVVRDETHMARFGEIEQRGVALTRTGRALYDACLAEAREPREGLDYDARLIEAFSRFPDDLETLRKERLAFFRYQVTDAGCEAADYGNLVGTTLSDWLDAGWVIAHPILYEDFLPVSAAGIFRSNLADDEQAAYDARSSRSAFEAALGGTLLDPFDLYEKTERASVARVMQIMAAQVAAIRQA